MRTANLRVFDKDRRPIGVQVVTDAQVRRAFEIYDSRWPSNDYPRTSETPHVKTWFENQAFKFAVVYAGRCYPPKAILRLAMGRGPVEGYHFFGGGKPGNANWVLQVLRFEVVHKSECGQRHHGSLRLIGGVESLSP